MSFKEEFSKERDELVHNKRPYETAAAVIFGVFFLQQIGILLYRTVEYFIDVFDSTITTAYFSCAGMTTPAFFARIVGINSGSGFIIALAFLALVFYYFLIYVLVFRYLQKRNQAKWTWTTLILFGPTIVFVPPYIWFIVYVFRPYFFRFIKTVVEEYKAFDPKTKFKEEQPEPEQAPSEEVAH